MHRAGDIVVEWSGAVARLRIRNAERRNAVSSAMWEALRDFAEQAAHRAEVRAVVIRGEGERAFSAGADISEFDRARGDAAIASRYDDLVESACCALEALPQTTVALVRGACVGAGASIAASCDFRVASSDAMFALPAARLGLGYDPRGISRLVRVFGLPAARFLVLSGEPLAAARAHELGAVDYLAQGDPPEALAEALCERACAHAPLSVRAAKAAFRALDLGADEALLERARQLARDADQSADYAEGRDAFAARRTPRFEGR